MKKNFYENLEDLLFPKHTPEAIINSLIGLMSSPFGTMKPFFFYKNNKRFVKLIEVIGEYLVCHKQLEELKKSKETNLSARVKVSTELCEIIRKRVAINMEMALGIEREKFEFSVNDSDDCYVISFKELK